MPQDIDKIKEKDLEIERLKKINEEKDRMFDEYSKNTNKKFNEINKKINNIDNTRKDNDFSEEELLKMEEEAKIKTFTLRKFENKILIGFDERREIKYLEKIIDYDKEGKEIEKEIERTVFFVDYCYTYFDRFGKEQTKMPFLLLNDKLEKETIIMNYREFMRLSSPIDFQFIREIEPRIISSNSKIKEIKKVKYSEVEISGKTAYDKFLTGEVVRNIIRRNDETFFINVFGDKVEVSKKVVNIKK